MTGERREGLSVKGCLFHCFTVPITQDNTGNTIENKEVKESNRVRERPCLERMESEDYISKLPDDVIHHILSFIELPKAVARTSILSKRWRELWYSLPYLTFVEIDFASKTRFLNYVDKSLKLRVENNTGLRKLSIHMVCLDATVRIYLHNWLDLVIKANIGDLDINILNKTDDLPKHVVLIDSLSRLRLSGCTMTGLNNIMLPQLQKLCLVKVQLDEQTIQSLMSNCKSMEDLSLIWCSGLNELQICNHIQLNRVKIFQCEQLRKVELGCSNLHTIWVHGEDYIPCEISLDGCKFLKKLTLGCIGPEFFEKLECFPHLETLDIRKLDGLRRIEISNTKLQRLALKRCMQMYFVSINAPNLQSFVFWGHEMPLIEMHPCSLRHAKLCFEFVNLLGPLRFQKQYCIPEIMKFIRKLDREGGYKLLVPSEKNIVIYENLDEVLLPEQRYLSIDIVSPSMFLKAFDSLMSIYHPETLCMVFPSNKEFPELMYKEMKNNEGASSCCKYFSTSNKCWRHFLKDIKIADFGDARNRWTYSWLNWLKHEQKGLPHHLTTFRLYWKDLQNRSKYFNASSWLTI